MYAFKIYRARLKTLWLCAKVVYILPQTWLILAFLCFQATFIRTDMLVHRLRTHHPTDRLDMALLELFGKHFTLYFISDPFKQSVETFSKHRQMFLMLYRSVTDPRTGKRVALKKMPNIFKNITSAKRAYRELKMLCCFEHDNVSFCLILL